MLQRTVTVASTDAQLTTTQAVKDLLGVTGTSIDSAIDRLITQASRWAESYLAKGPLTVQSYREAVPGYGSRRLVLSARPIRAVISLWDSTDTGSATTYLSSEFSVDEDAGFIERDGGFAWDVDAVPQPFAVPLASAPRPGEEEPGWLADYVAGWTIDGVSTDSPNWSTEKGTTSTGRTLPEDIEEAVQLRVIERAEGRYGVKSRAVGDLRIAYGSGEESLSAAARELLDAYRSFA